MLIVLLFAVLAGGLAGYSALQFLRTRTTTVQAAEPPRAAAHVVMAARDLPVGHLIGEEDVKLVEWPGAAVPDGFAQTIPEVIGRGLLDEVKLNEALLDTKMADRAGIGGLRIVIPEGMRAFAMRVDEIVAVAGFVVVGARVDLYLTVSPPGGAEPITKLIMQNVEVLTLAQNPERDPEGNPVVVSVLTVLLTPEDGEKLIHAQRQGQIQLALRNHLDLRDVQTSGARVANLLSGSRAPSGRGVRARAVGPTSAGAQSSTVEVYKGGVKSIIKF